MSPMAIGRHEQDGVAVVDVDGDLDLASVGDVDAALQDALSGGEPVVVDLEDVSFIDSTGMKAMIEDVIDPRETRPTVIRALEMAETKRVDRPWKLNGVVPV